MAHIPVVRRSLSTEEWIDLRINQLRQFIILDREPILNAWIREGRLVGPRQCEWEDKDWRPLRKGDWIFKPDGFSVLKLQFSYPNRFDGKKVYFSLLTAAEMMVREGERWLGGIDPNRSRIKLTDAARGGEPHEIELEAYNRSKPDDDRHAQTRHLRGCRQEYRGAELVLIDSLVETVYYDCMIIRDTLRSSLVAEDIREYLKKHLDEALNFVGWIADIEVGDRNTLHLALNRMKDYFQQHIFHSRSCERRGYRERVALVAHSHLDVAYYWRRLHAIGKHARTCLIQLRLMDEYPYFRYVHTQPYLLETLRDEYPEIFNELLQREKEGRFELAGAMYVEPDCNLPGAESLIRQCLYGQRFYLQHVGHIVRNCWLPDVFGNSCILPQILKLAGVDYFVSNKMSTWNDTNRFPYSHFVWKGLDGSKILACVPPRHFITWNDPHQILENWRAFPEKGISPATMNMFGFGDGGSGVTEEMLAYWERLNQVPGLPEVYLTGGQDFLDENLGKVADALPEWDGELYLEMHRGTFTSKGWLKKENRRCEELLRDIEFLLTLRIVEDKQLLERWWRIKEKLDEAWKLLLINQFHDILPGTHIPPVTQDALQDYKRIRQLTLEILEEIGFLKLVTQPIPESIPQTWWLWNTLGIPRRGPFFVPYAVKRWIPSEGVVQHGIRSGEEGFWLELAQPLPPYTSLPLSMKASDSSSQRGDDTSSASWCSILSHADGYEIHTLHSRIRLNEKGEILSWKWLGGRRELVADNQRLNSLQAFADYPGMYDAWDILENWEKNKIPVQILKPLVLIQEGPLYVEFEMTYQIRESIGIQRIRFFRNTDLIEFDHKVDWKERNCLLKVMFDINTRMRLAACDTGAGTLYRETHRNTSWQQARFEVCHHRWVALGDRDAGLAILNDSKYGVNLLHNRIALSLLRGPIRPDPDSDIGQHYFVYGCLPYQDNVEAAQIPQMGWAFNVSPRWWIPDSDKPSKTFFKIQHGENLHLLACKPAEDNPRECILRWVEINGKSGTFILQFFVPVESVKSVNLLEVPYQTQESFTMLGNGQWEGTYSPWQIITARIMFT